MLCENCVSGTVLMIQLTRNSPTCAYMEKIKATWITNRIVFNNESIFFYILGKNKHSNYKFEGIYEIKSGVFILPSREQ